MGNERVICTGRRYHPLQVRLDAIARAHEQDRDASGGTWGDCVECGWRWPCPTYRWCTDPGVGLFCDWDLDDCGFHDGLLEPRRHERVTDWRPV